MKEGVFPNSIRKAEVAEDELGMFRISKIGSIVFLFKNSEILRNY